MDGKPANLSKGSGSLKRPYLRADVKARLSKHANRRITRYGDHPRLRRPELSRSGDFVTASVCFPSASQPGHRIAQVPVPQLMVQEVVNEKSSRSERPALASPAKKRRGGKRSYRRRQRRRAAARRKPATPAEVVLTIPPRFQTSAVKRRNVAAGKSPQTRGERTVQLMTRRQLKKLTKYVSGRRRWWDLRVPGVKTKTIGGLRSTPSISPRPVDAPKGFSFWPWPERDPTPHVGSRKGAEKVAKELGVPLASLQHRKCKKCGISYQGARKGQCDRCFAKSQRK